MKTVILAGGFGTRLTEETEKKPKPMIEIGSRPMLWHIMKIFSSQGYQDFVVALGYKAEVIKRYFVEFAHLSGNLSVQIKDGKSDIIRKEQDEWNIDLVDTGFHSNTGGRLKQLAEWVDNEAFMLTYGDGVSNVCVEKLKAFHQSHGKLATVTAVRPPARFGGLNISPEGTVTAFSEKPQSGEGWINGGFMVLEPQVLEMIEDNKSSLEADVLETLASEGQLAAYRHDGFWQCMDTLRELRYLEHLWSTGKAPWKLWHE